MAISSSVTLTLANSSSVALVEKKLDLVPVQVKSCDFSVMSLKVREVVEVIVGFLVPLLPARERESQTVAYNALIKFIQASFICSLALNKHTRAVEVSVLH